MANQTATREYVLNLETSKIELHFSKEDYQALSNEEKSTLKRAYLFSGKQKAWVSRSKNNHYNAISAAKKLGFVNSGKIGERLSFSDEMERGTEKAEARAERFETYSDNAEKRGKNLQSEFNERRKDWSWVTQPNINSSGGRSFTNQKNKVIARFEKGFDEYRKSEYYKDRAKTARMTADQSKLNNKTYLNNRIEETNKTIRQIQNGIVNAENTNNTERLESLLDRMEYEIDKLAYFENCMDDLGGVQYDKNNVKKGYLVKIRGRYGEVLKANPKTIEVKFDHVSFSLKYVYAEIQDMQIPEGWTEKKEVAVNPFSFGDMVVSYAIGGERIIKAFQIVKTTPKNVMMQQIQIEDNKPLQGQFISDEQLRRRPTKDYSKRDSLDFMSWMLYKYNTN